MAERVGAPAPTAVLAWELVTFSVRLRLRSPVGGGRQDRATRITWMAVNRVPQGRVREGVATPVEEMFGAAARGTDRRQRPVVEHRGSARRRRTAREAVASDGVRAGKWGTTSDGSLGSIPRIREVPVIAALFAHTREDGLGPQPRHAGQRRLRRIALPPPSIGSDVADQPRLDDRAKRDQEGHDLAGAMRSLQRMKASLSCPAPGRTSK